MVPVWIFKIYTVATQTLPFGLNDVSAMIKKMISSIGQKKGTTMAIPSNATKAAAINRNTPTPKNNKTISTPVMSIITKNDGIAAR